MATDFTKQQLSTILSALDDQPRKPANRAAALKAIAKSATTYGLSPDDVLQAAAGLLDGRLSPADFRAELKDQPVPPTKPKTRAGTKQARMIEMLRRPEGATVEQIAAATGWQHHTIRGAISGALKKKLGLKIEATKGEAGTVYRIVASN